MKQVELGHGPFPKTPASAETIYSAFNKTNSNFAELERRISAQDNAIIAARVAGYHPSAPYLLRGTVAGRLWDGVTQGVGLPQPARRANLRGLQAAIDYAVAYNKFFELEPGIFEIEGMDGLVIPPSKSGFQWRGSKGTVLTQFSSDCPILTIGEVGRCTGETQDLHFSGVRLRYASDQSENLRSSALRIGLLRNSTIEQIAVFADYGLYGPLIKAYRGIHIAHETQPFGFFSNTVRDVTVAGADHSLLDIALVGTGSIFSNVYLTQGVTGHPAAIAKPFSIDGAADLYEGVFEQLNIEWCIANTIVVARNCRATSFVSTHLEGNELCGRAPSVILAGGSQLTLTGINVLDLGVRHSSIDRLPAPAMIRCHDDSAISGTNIQLSWSAPGKVDMGLEVVGSVQDEPSDLTMMALISQLTVRDASGDNSRFVALDSNLSNEDGPVPDVLESYAYGIMLSRIGGAKLNARASMTLFGQYSEPSIHYPAILGAPRSITLSNRMKRNGAGQAIFLRAGSLVSVRRNSGDADAFNLSINNHDGAVISVISTSNVTRWFIYDGTNWEAIT